MNYQLPSPPIQRVDVAVGDISVTDQRSAAVDFTDSWRSFGKSCYGHSVSNESHQGHSRVSNESHQSHSRVCIESPVIHSRVSNESHQGTVGSLSYSHSEITFGSLLSKTGSQLGLL